MFVIAMRLIVRSVRGRSGLGGLRLEREEEEKDEEMKNNGKR